MITVYVDANGNWADSPTQKTIKSFVLEKDHYQALLDKKAYFDNSKNLCFIFKKKDSPIRIWSETVIEYIMNNILDLTTTQETQFTSLDLYYQRRGELPDINLIEQKKPEIFQYLLTAVKSGEIPPHPQFANES